MITESTAIKPLEILDILREYQFLEDFSLALYYERDGVVTRLGAAASMCGVLSRSLTCSDKCEPTFVKGVKLALERDRPAVFNCRAGLMNFAVPYRPSGGFNYCFVGGGVRNQAIDIFLADRLAIADSVDGITLLKRLEELPASTPQAIREAALRVRDLLQGLNRDCIQGRLLERNLERYDALRGILARMETSASLDEVTAILMETLCVLFDIPRVALGISHGPGGEIGIRGLRGAADDLGFMDAGRLAALFREGIGEPAKIAEGEIGHYFPAVAARRAVCLPLAAEETLLGFVAFFDLEPNPRDAILIGILADRVALKALQFWREDSYRLERSLTDRFMSVLTDITSLDNRRDLYVSILKTAADLVNASSGSLMLIDESGRNLRIESVMGMNLQLARSMNARVGRGIAGKVAESGEPLLVKDIEQDGRVRIANRSRFKTRSFVSIPLKVRGSVIGVLNLSDKGDGGVFCEEDLALLTTVALHACLVLERTDSREKAALLEETTVTDPLTGLFNRRFLVQRLEEEISRGGRQQQSLTVLLADLDHLKVYNELCGYAAGDVVLRKVARLFKGSARQMDVVTRNGGDRFCVILPATPKKEALCVAERFRREVEQAGFTHEENLPLGRLTISIGIATAPQDGPTPEALLASAEVALQRAKLAGRNHVAFFESPGTGRAKSLPPQPGVKAVPKTGNSPDGMATPPPTAAPSIGEA